MFIIFDYYSRHCLISTVGRAANEIDIRGTPPISAVFQTTLITCHFDNWLKPVYFHHMKAKMRRSTVAYLFRWLQSIDET